MEQHFGPLIFLIIIIAWIWQSIRRLVPAVREAAAGTQAIQGPGGPVPPRRAAPPSPRPLGAPAPPTTTIPRPAARPAFAPVPAPPRSRAPIVSMLSSPSSLSNAVIVAEVLAPPVALR